MTPSASFLQAAVSLRAQAPDAWNAFLVELEGAAAQLMRNTVESPLPALPTNQGRAQQALELVKVLKQAPELLERVKAARDEGVFR